MRSSWIRVGPKSNDKEEGKEEARWGNRHRTWGGRSADTMQILEGCVCKPRAAKHTGIHEKLGQRHGTDCPQDTSQPCRHLEFRLLASRIMTE